MKKFPSNAIASYSNAESLTKQQHYLISHLTHEVRNPLTLVHSSLQLLEKECPSVKTSLLWTQIREDIHSTINLLQEISVWNNTSACCLNTFSIKEFFSSLAVSFASYMAERNITFSVYINDSLTDQQLTADKRKLQEALTNLLINAADALHTMDSPNTSDCIDDSESSADPYRIFIPEITLTAELFDKNLHIHVKDNGPGIPESYLPTLFEPFITHKTSGTGLGLSIVQNVAKLHGGTVSVETSCAAGQSYTDFCIQLPFIPG